MLDDHATTERLSAGSVLVGACIAAFGLFVFSTAQTVFQVIEGTLLVILAAILMVGGFVIYNLNLLVQQRDISGRHRVDRDRVSRE